MKSSKVLKILNISRQTLVKYVKNGDIRVVMQTNKQYDYNEEDVYRKAGLNNGIKIRRCKKTGRRYPFHKARNGIRARSIQNETPGDT